MACCRCVHLQTHSPIHTLIPLRLVFMSYVSVYTHPQLPIPVLYLQAPVDVMGVVMAVGAAGTIKRKANNEEVWRRDVTLADNR